MTPLQLGLRRFISPRGRIDLVVATMLATGVACGGQGDSLPIEASQRSLPVPAPGTYVLDPDHSFILFSAQHMVVGRVRGRFNTMRGTAQAATDPHSSSVDIVIDAASVDTQNDARDAHLRGPAFFDVEGFPTIAYHGSGLRANGQSWVVNGQLTIHGVTRSVPLELTFKGTAPLQEGSPRRIAVHGTAAVKRADFGMTHGLLNEIGAVSSNPDVWIEIDAEFLAQEPSAELRQPDQQP